MGFKMHNDDIQRALDQAVTDGLSGTMLLLSAMLKEKLNQAGTGRAYGVTVAGRKFLKAGKKIGKNPRRKGVHIASAAGYPPAPDTQTLKGSWSIDHVGQGLNGYATIDLNERRGRLEMGSRVAYAAMLEFGTKRMQPRPYLVPVLELAEPRIEPIFARAFARAFASQP